MLRILSLCSLWSLISAVGCTIFSNRNKCFASYANAAKHISNSNEIKAHACFLYCIHLSWIPHAICSLQKCRSHRCQRCSEAFEFRSLWPGNIFAIYFTQLLIFLKATNFCHAFPLKQSIYAIAITLKHTHSLPLTLSCHFICVYTSTSIH